MYNLGQGCAPGMTALDAPLHRRIRAGLLVSIVALVALLMIAPTGSYLGVAGTSAARDLARTTDAAVRVGQPAAGPNSAIYNWPELHLNNALTGYYKNTTLSTANASELGVHWAFEMYGQAIDSPSVAYNPILNETLVYIGTNPGYLMAINLATEQVVWSDWLGTPIASSPTISDGSLYVATDRNSALYNINDTTGVIQCSLPIPFIVQSTATVATPPGGVRSVFIGAENTGANGPIYAINAGNCSVEWSYAGYAIITGNWDPVSYAVSQNGTGVVLIGTANPDSAIYEFNAVTGQLYWRYMTYFPPGGNFDIGAGVTISAPGVNGFKYGVAYTDNKYGDLVALNLSSGKAIWNENINNLTGGKPPSRATPALAGDNLIIGHQGGVLDISAINGSVLWQYKDPTDTEVLSSPAIVGAKQATAVIVAADLSGAVTVLSLATGSVLYSYQTGGYITGSPAIYDGNILIDSTDTLLYDFQVGGGNDATLPSTTLSSPAYEAKVSNPKSGMETVYGNATDPVGVTEVGVAVEAGGVGTPWWDGTTGSWVAGPYTNYATLGSPGATSTAWTYQFPVPVGGAAYTVEANAISLSGQTDNIGASTAFTVLASTTAPHVKANPTTVAPGGTTTINGGAFGHGELVTIRFVNETLATERASKTGYLANIKVTIPKNASFGLNAITATGASTGKMATTSIEVLNDWDAVGNNATHTGNEPNDLTFYDQIAVGPGNFIHVAWYYTAGVPINASPVVANDVVYFGDTAGTVYALDVHNGGSYWTVSPTGGSPIEQDAVDPTLGLLYVTAQNGSIYALSTATGATVWSDDIGGNLSAPEIATHGLYIASTTGDLELLNPSTGAVVWTDVLASEVTASPAISDTGKLLAIGESNGDMLGINAQNGKKEWTYATSGAIDAAATVYNGSILFGSANGDVYSLSFNGKLNWKYATGSPVEDTGALTYTTNAGVPGGGVPLLIIGNNAGTAYALRASNGKLWFTQVETGAVVSAATVQGMIVVERAGGDVDADRNYADYGLFNLELGPYLTTTPAIVNGAIYITGGSGVLDVYTCNGRPPA